MVGAVIGSYQIIRKLGAGGMGAVYVGQHTLLGRRAAIKVLLPSLSARQDVVKRFFNEARAVTTINDPGIVQVFDFGVHSDGCAFLVMELLDGEPLDHRITRRGNLAISDALRIGQQIATSLAAAHDKRIIHRDLKPENIFLVRDSGFPSGERTKILDFGIAKLSGDQPGKSETHTGVLLGTPKYMSPEQCRGASRIDHRADIYSLGCVLFHMLTGRPPFDGDGVSDVISSHLRDPAPAPSRLVAAIPAPIDELVQRCLAKSPAERFPSMTALSAAMAETLLLISPPAALPSSSANHAMIAVSSGLPVQPAPAPLAPTVPPDGILPAVLPTLLPPTATTLPQRTPTTLGESSGQFARLGPPPRRIGRWIAVSLVAVAVVLGIVIIRPHAQPASDTAQAAVVERSSPQPRDHAGAFTRTGELDAGIDAPPTREPPVDASNPDAEEITIEDPGVEPGGPEEPAPVEEPQPERPATPRDRPAGPTSTRPPSSPGPASPSVRSPGPRSPPQKKCGRAELTAVYNDRAPTNDAIHAALRALNACRREGQITQDEFERIQSALVTRLH